MSLAVLIVAAGRGLRAGLAGPKQFRPLGGEPLLRHSVRLAAHYPGVTHIQLVIGPNDGDSYDDAVAPFADKLLPAVTGGSTRQESVRNGLEALAQHAPEIVLIHDAARPFADEDVLGRVLEALEHLPAALPALPIVDTLKRGKKGRVTGTVEREEFWRAQTPQGFRFEPILAAHRAAAESSRHDFTDDAAIAEWAGLEVALVEGSEANVKLTTQKDFELAEARIKSERPRRPERVCVGFGYDVHAFGSGDHVMLCGVRVPHDQSLIGHSDADVALHAITDAILGAIGDGDIGVHFPPAEPKWAGAASELFLRDAHYRVDRRGGSIDHVDLTLVCETPKIGPHREAMRTSLANMLDISIEQVGLKATTSEGMGFTGRGEGIVAMATATVRLP